MTDIIDEIGALVDEQLSGYRDRSGYEYNVNQDRCHHCGREWHGLKITARIESMAAHVSYDEDYRYADDDSEVLCPGSSFIGPWATKLQIQAIRTARLVGGVPSVPYTRMREHDDHGIESTPWSAPRIRNNPFSRRYSELRVRPLGYSLPNSDEHGWSEIGQVAEFGLGPVEDLRRREPAWQPSQLTRGDVIAMDFAGGRRQFAVIVDIVEHDDGTTSFVTEDPRYSARAQQLRDALACERASAREAQIRGAEVSQTIVDETHMFDDSQWSILTSRFRDSGPIPPELQFPREWPDFIEATLRMLGSPNPFLAAESQHGPQPEPDTRTSQERALPRPSTTPPMWAVDAGRQRRTRTNSRRRHR